MHKYLFRVSESVGSSKRSAILVFSMKRNGDEGKQPKAAKKAKKAFDFSRFLARKIALRVAYLGFEVPEGLVQQKNDDGTVEVLSNRVK